MSKTFPIIPFVQFEYSKAKRTLQISSEPYGAPREFFVESPRTGRIVRFVSDEQDMLANEFYDGEAASYMPAPGERECGIIRAFIINQW